MNLTPRFEAMIAAITIRGVFALNYPYALMFQSIGMCESEDAANT